MLAEYIPKTPNGAVLVTTRYSHIGFRLAREQDVLSIGTMDERFAPELLKRKTGTCFDQHKATELVHAIECMPLALSQASAFVIRRAPEVSMADYLEILLTKDRDAPKAKLLQYDNADDRRDQEATNSVITTWQLSFDYIRAERPTAAQLLALMSFFDRQDIPRYVVLPPWLILDLDGKLKPIGHLSEFLLGLGDWESRNEDITAELSHDISSEFSEDVVMLTDFYLISNKRKTFDMHGLVQLATRAWLKMEGQFIGWNGEFVARMWKFLPDDVNIEHWPSCKILSSHVGAMASHEPDYDKIAQIWILSLLNAGKYALSNALAVIAENVLRPALVRSQRISEPNAMITMSIESHLIIA